VENGSIWAWDVKGATKVRRTTKEEEMSPDGALANLMPLLSLFAVAAAGLFAYSAMPRDNQRAQRRNEHLQAFLGKSREEPVAISSEEVADKPEEKPTWRGVDLSIFED
jgi:hypothetical protein